MKSYKARGIVLNTLKYGEKGLIVHMLTDTGGRQSYMVQGVRTASRGSRMALMQPMFALEFEGFVSSRMSMHRMKDVHSGIVLQSIPFDVRKSTMALFMAETLYRLVRSRSLTARCSISYGGRSRRSMPWRRVWPTSTYGFWPI